MKATDFRAHCPKCGGTRWLDAFDHAQLLCATESCDYVHYLSGPVHSAIIEPHSETIAPTKVPSFFEDERSIEKRNRIKQIVFSLLESGNHVGDITELITKAVEIDMLLEQIK